MPNPRSERIDGQNLNKVSLHGNDTVTRSHPPLGLRSTLCEEDLTAVKTLKNTCLTRILASTATAALTLGVAAPATLAPVLWPTAVEAAATPESFADLVETVSPAVVQIAAKNQNPAIGPSAGGPSQMPEQFREFFERHFGEQMPGGGDPAPHGPRGAIGSGFIVDGSGIIVTNNHVVGSADEITVTLKDGRSFPAELLGADEKTDLAVLKVKTDKTLPTVPWGESAGTRVGDWVLAVGNPFGLSGTVTAGIVSARGRDIGAGPYDDFMQIDAPLNSGNSGGPLFDGRGRVIGVNTAIFSPNGGNVGIGFAIPSDTAKGIVAELQSKGRVERGWLGVGIQPVTPEIADSLGLAKAEGALVASVAPDSPAAKAGVRPGDIVTGFGGKPIATAKDLSRAVAASEAGGQRILDVVRNGKSVGLPVDIGKANPTLASAGAPSQGERSVQVPALGLKLATLDAQARTRLGVAADTPGAVIVGVDGSKDASGKGLRPGDLITRVNQQEVSAPGDVVRAVEQAAKDHRKAVLLMVERNQEQRFVVVEMSKA